MTDEELEMAETYAERGMAPLGYLLLPGARSNLKVSDLLAEVRRLRAELETARAALAGLVDWNRHRYPPKMGGGEFPPTLARLMVAAGRALGDIATPAPADANGGAT